MTLVFSDLHLGRSPERDSVLVTNLSRCIDSYGQAVDEVVFLGDIFDAFLEYPDSVQSIALLMQPVFQGLLDNNISVHYHVGNHDPWHLSFFSETIGIPVYSKPVIREIDGLSIYFSHGDEEDIGGRMSRGIRQIIRSGFSYRLYRFVLPARFGQWLPEWVSRGHSSSIVKLQTAVNLAGGAGRILRSTDCEVVIFGHSHQQLRSKTSDGLYINTGSWFVDGSYVEITSDSIAGRKWKSK